MKANATKTVAAKRNGKRAAAQNIETNGARRPRVKSTVPPQFRELKQLAAANDPRFWELRREFKDYFYTLPEAEIEPFVEGLGEPYLGYLFIELARESVRNNPISIWGTDYSEYFKAE